MAGDDPLAHWVQAQCDLADGRLEAVREHAAALEGTPLGLALAAQADLREGCGEADERAARAYAAAVLTGGFDLLAAAPIHAWCLGRAGRWAEASTVADTLRRQVGRHDMCARLHAALVHLAAARASGDRSTERLAAATVEGARRLGFASVEEQARTALPPLTTLPVALAVRLLGDAHISVGGAAVPAAAWRSRKAREVLLLLALSGTGGRTREEIIEAVWPEREPERGRMLLRNALATTRRALEPDRPPGAPSAFLTTSGDRVSLAAEVDLHEVRRLARSGDARAALALCVGELLADEPYLEWLDEERHAVRALRLDLAERVAADTRAPVRERAEALEFLLAAEPWRGELARRLAALWVAVGDEPAARDAVRRHGS